MESHQIVHTLPAMLKISSIFAIIKTLAGFNMCLVRSSILTAIMFAFTAITVRNGFYFYDL